MKKVFTMISVFLSVVSGISQSPDKMSYQAVIRNSGGELVANKIISMQISILQGSANGIVVYAEAQSPSTNGNGLVGVEIGGGTVLNGNYSNIDWANGPYFIKIETDPEGGPNFTITGTSQLLSVPYALHAKTAETVTENIPETDPVFNASVAAGITGTDIAGWNAKLGSYTEIQNLADVIAINNAAYGQIKKVKEPTDSQDAATKAYVDQLLKIIQTLQNGITDPDGNHYNTVLIGNQIWMRENLKTNKLNDGTLIHRENDDSQWGSLLIPGYCWLNNDSGTYADPYGAFYNWYTIETGKLCPVGWHLPTMNDLTTLFNSIGGQTGGGGKLKETGTAHWSLPNTGATNESGFTGVPAGYRMVSGEFNALGSNALYWTDTDTTIAQNFNTIALDLKEISANAYLIGFTNKSPGLTVRCIKD